MISNYNPEKFIQKNQSNTQTSNIDLLTDLDVKLEVLLGETNVKLKDVLNFKNGNIIELNKLYNEPVKILVQGQQIAEGEVVVINEKLGIKIKNILH